MRTHVINKNVNCILKKKRDERKVVIIKELRNVLLTATRIRCSLHVTGSSTE